jgi:hypothetical protein
MAKTSPQVSFWLPYGLAAASFVTGLTVNAGFGGMPLFRWLPVFVAVIVGVWLSILRKRGELRPLATPESYSPQHFLLLIWLSVQGFLVDQGLHAAFEPLMLLVVFVIPGGFVVGAIGRVWSWAVVSPSREMQDMGIALPVKLGYFAPFVSYAWLWHFAKGMEVVSARRIPAGGAFAAVLFLGVIGFLIIRARLKQVTGI